MPITKARPTTYKGIEMRSRLEAGFAAWLDQRGFAWSYEPRAFASEAGQYLPDFRIDDLEWLGIGRGIAYIEVKPSIWGTRAEVDALRRQMLLIHESEPHALLVLAREGWQPTVVLDAEDYPFAICSWCHGSGATPALAWLYGPSWCPWAGDYWKVG